MAALLWVAQERLASKAVPSLCRPSQPGGVKALWLVRQEKVMIEELYLSVYKMKAQADFLKLFQGRISYGALKR